MSRFAREARPQKHEEEGRPPDEEASQEAQAPHEEQMGRGSTGPGTPSGPAGGEQAGAGQEQGLVVLRPEEHQALAQKASERDLYLKELLRARADLDNYHKRVLRERSQIQDQAVRRLVADLLPVLDNFDRALGASGRSQEGGRSQERAGPEAVLKTVRDGIQLVRQMLLKTFRDHGVEEIPAEGQPFDPLLHDAVIHEQTDAFPPGTVSEVLEKGYSHKGTVVRPSRVKVARGAGPAGSPGEGWGGSGAEGPGSPADERGAEEE